MPLNFAIALNYLIAIASISTDADGTAYTYTWKLWNSAGTSVVKTYTGKSITVAKTDVTGKGVLMCEVSK